MKEAGEWRERGRWIVRRAEFLIKDELQRNEENSSHLSQSCNILLICQIPCVLGILMLLVLPFIEVLGSLAWRHAAPLDVILLVKV
jgi:hypothetical protein